MKLRISWSLFLAFFIITFGSIMVHAESTMEESTIIEIEKSLYVKSDNADRLKICIKYIDDEFFLFLPSNMNVDEVVLYNELDNVEVKKNDTFIPVVTTGSGIVLKDCIDSSENLFLKVDKNKIKIKVMKANNVASIHIQSTDSINNGRLWVESSANHTNVTTGFMTMYDENNQVVYDGALDQIKGRGNTTWTMAKRPYQIKLSEKTDLMNTGLKSEKNKKWILLSNYPEANLLKNYISYYLGRESGMKETTNCKYVDLYYDGEFRGLYLLTEKVEVSSGRVDITDLEKSNKEINTDVEDYSALSKKRTTNAYGCEFQYVDGIASPEDISGGYCIRQSNFQSNAH